MKSRWCRAGRVLSAACWTRSGVEIFLSGSSARLLSREVATQMRGRAMETLVLPFSFREYLRTRARSR